MTREKPLDVMKRELWLDRRLREHGVPIIDGITDTAERKRRARAAILEHGLANIVAGRRAGDPRGRPIDYREAFQHVFGEPLETSESEAA